MGEGVLDKVQKVALTTVVVSLAAVCVQLPFLMKNLIVLTGETKEFVKKADDAVSGSLELVEETAPTIFDGLANLMKKLSDAVGECDKNKVNDIIGSVNKVLASLNDVLKGIGVVAPEAVKDIRYMFTAVQYGYVIPEADLVDLLKKSGADIGDGGIVDTLKFGHNLTAYIGRTHNASVTLAIRLIPDYIFDFLKLYDASVPKVDGSSKKPLDGEIIDDLKRNLYLYDVALKHATAESNGNVVTSDVAKFRGLVLGSFPQNSEAYNDFKKFLDEDMPNHVANWRERQKRIHAEYESAKILTGGQTPTDQSSGS